MAWESVTLGGESVAEVEVEAGSLGECLGCTAAAQEVAERASAGLERVSAVGEGKEVVGVQAVSEAAAGLGACLADSAERAEHQRVQPEAGRGVGVLEMEEREGVAWQVGVQQAGAVEAAAMEAAAEASAVLEVAATVVVASVARTAASQASRSVRQAAQTAAAAAVAGAVGMA